MNTQPTALAQLRHLYQNMLNGGVRDADSAKRIADGLLGPAIAALEAHVQNPAKIAHVAGDVSKNGRKSNMAQAPAVPAGVLTAIRAAGMHLLRGVDDVYLLVPAVGATAQAAPQPEAAVDERALLAAKVQFLDWNRAQGADRPIFNSYEYFVCDKAVKLYVAALAAQGDV